MPTTSIIITAYNVERYIGRAIRSALNQSHDPNLYEIIVVNDCSTDRTRFALEVFEDGVNKFFAREFEEAKKAFEYILKENPMDAATHRLLGKAVALWQNGVPDDWTGVEEMFKK